MTLYDVLGLNLADCMHAGGGAKAVYSDNDALRSKVVLYTMCRSARSQRHGWWLLVRAMN